MGLFYSKDSKLELVGYADAGYRSDPHKGRSQAGYIFTYGETTISWCSTKQTLAATSSNHAELLALHEASHDCVWLRSLVHHIRDSCGLSVNKRIPTTLYADNEAFIIQTREGYIKGDRTKHIDPKFFFTHELQQRG
ncbi:secreted RxLR effector protein 161-like [Apium graveolens]|uniref:secreted RxLR effector protein 161-like n=1 Tax=Apium graveolens TaxID=4045 RepID=UPI003D7A2F15